MSSKATGRSGMNARAQEQRRMNPACRIPPERRHGRSPSEEAETPDRSVSEQLAVVAGVSAYESRKLVNAAADARALGTLLQEDYEFRLLPSGGPLLDGDANLATLQGAIEASLEQGTPDSRWLFYFAGHGDVVDEKGFLQPADSREDVPESLLALEWLVERALGSRHAEILIVLDMCYAGRALMKPDVQPWLDAEEGDSRGTVQLLAAGGPGQTVLDGGGRGHSIFSRCLLDALEGEAGIHGEAGEVRFTPLLEHLDVAVERRLAAMGMDPGQQQLLGVTVRAGLKGTVKGDFRFQARGPRLPPGVVRGLRADDSRVRRESLAALSAACRARPEDWPLPKRLEWNLPLATRLVLRGLPEGRIGDALADEEAASTEQDWQVRRQLAVTLGELGELGLEQVEAAREAAARAAEPLLHLALRDPDPAVRREAGKSLARALDPTGQLKTGRRLEGLRDGVSRGLRRRLWRARVALPVYRRQLATATHGRALLTLAGLVTGDGWRWVVRHTWRRSLAIASLSATALLYLVLGMSYYVSTDPVDNVVIRRGIPGFEILPGIGDAVVFTDHHATALADRAAATEERLVGSWLPLQDGAFNWGRRLADRLGAARAGLELWRLGDPDAALGRLREGIAGGDGTGVRIAAYLAIQSAAMADPVLELTIEALANEDTRAATLQALEILRQLRPEAAEAKLTALADGLEGASWHELPALLDAISVLGVDDPAVVEAALRHTLVVLSQAADARSERRMTETLRRLLAAHPELSEIHLEDLVDLAQRPSSNRTAFLELLKIPAELGSDARRQAMAAALELLEDDREPGRISALGLLGRVLDGRPSWIEESVPTLTALADGSDPETLLAVSDLVAGLPSELVPREAFTERLRTVVRDGSRYRLRNRAMETLVKLTGGDDATVRLLLATTADPDTDVRAQAVRHLVELALDGRTDPATVEPALASALGDQSPGIRQEAAQGILLLSDRDAADYDKAFFEVAPEVTSVERGWSASRAFGQRFRHSTPAAAARFASRLLAAVRSQSVDDEAHLVFRILEGLVLSQPKVLPELVPAMADLLAFEEETDWPWRTAWFLRNLQVEHGFNLASVSERFLGFLHSPSVSDREAAAYVLGAAVGSRNEALRVVREIERAIAADESSVVARSAFSLQWMAHSRHGLADEVLPLLLQGLADPRPPVRAAFARALSEAAEADPPSLSGPPAELGAALDDPAPEIRRLAARTLGLWGRQRSSELQPAVPWIRERLAREDELRVRLQLAAALGVLAGDEPAVVDHVLDLAQAGLRSREESVQQAAMVILGDLGETHSSQARRVAGVFRAHRAQLEPSLRGLAVLMLRDLGRAHPQGGEAAVPALREYLFEDDDYHVRWSAMVNGLKYVVTAHPSLAPEAVAALESFLTSEDLGSQDRLASTAWEVWVELAVEPASQDLDFLWRRLTSPSRFYRRAALETLVRLVVQRPELLADVETGLARYRRSVRPQVRVAASMAAESIEVLRWAEAEASDTASEEAWNEVLEWMSKLGIHAVVEPARSARSSGTERSIDNEKRLS